MPARSAIAAYSAVASVAGSERYLYNVRPQPDSSMRPLGRTEFCTLRIGLGSSAAAGTSRYFPVSMPPASALYAMKP
eukprot:4026069-Prymnesium_polylepis.1